MFPRGTYRIEKDHVRQTRRRWSIRKIEATDGHALAYLRCPTLDPVRPIDMPPVEFFVVLLHVQADPLLQCCCSMKKGALRFALSAVLFNKTIVGEACRRRSLHMDLWIDRNPRRLPPPPPVHLISGPKPEYHIQEGPHSDDGV